MKFSELKDFNFSERINKGALLTATNKNGEINTMTVSWGSAGVLWNKEICTVFVRPQRYTYEFCESGDTLSLSFFGSERRDTLAFCGTKTGRDVDKFAHCELKFKLENGACIFDDAQVILVLKKLYAQDLKSECFFDNSPLINYKNNDFHRAYTCEIVDVIKK
ncbi:MAG: flavin reductase family protein [Ruminococcaceae bacterium]|nr:flavin reductase family protein [Oscillospiraceae bacterium]